MSPDPPVPDPRRSKSDRTSFVEDQFEPRNLSNPRRLNPDDDPSIGQDLPPQAREVLRPTQAEAEQALRVLLRWAGDDPDREGLLDTPARVARSYRELFGGYDTDPRTYLERVFEEVGGYDELVVLRDIPIASFCEHHMLPFIGKAHIGYLPSHRVVGISKLARVVHGFSRRLQIQEKLTAQVAETIQEILQPRGVGVVIVSEHSCIAMRGVNTAGSRMITSRLLGRVRDDPRTRQEFLELIHTGSR